MEDQEPNSEELEVAPQDADNSDVSQQSEENTQDSQPQAREDANERNWRAMRQRHKEMEYELKQKNEMLERLLQMQQQPQHAPQPIAEPEDPDDEFIPAGKVRGIAKKHVQPLEQKIQQLEAKIAQSEQEKRINHLRSRYPDFDDVVNVETLEIFEKTEPELANSIAQKKDPYEIGLQSYKYIKALNLAEQVPSARRKKEVDKKIAQNSKSVQSPMAYDKRPMAQAYKATQADSKRLYEEMMHYASQATGF